MRKGTQKRGWKSWFSGLMAIVLLIAMFPFAPEKAKAAGTLTVTSSVPGVVAGDTTDISLTYSNSALLSLNLGALDYILPTGIKATTNDQINGVNLIPSQILDNGQRVRLSGLSLSLLQANTTLLLKQKTVPNSGTYNFEAKIYGLALTVINTNPSEALSGSLLVSPLTLPLSSITTTNNSGDNDTLSVNGVKAQDIVKIYNTNGTLRTTLTASEDGTLSVPLTLTPSGGSVSVSLTRGGVESARVQVSYLAEIVPPIGVASIYVSNQPGNSDSVTVGNLTAGDIVRLYSLPVGGTSFATSSAVATGQTSVVIPTTLTRLGGTLYASRVRNGLESVRVPVVYLPEVLAALTANAVTITNGSGNSDLVRVTGLTPGDIVYVYATDGTLLDTPLTANSSGIAQGTITLKPGGGAVNVVLERDGLRSAALPVAYLAETVRSLLATEVTITNNPNNNDLIRVTGLETGDRIVVKIGTDDPFTSEPATGSAIDISTVLKPDGGSVTVGILRNTIEGPKLTLIYDAERVDAPTLAQIIAVNNSGAADMVTVSGLLDGDIAVVYGSANGTTELGRAVVGNNGIPTSAKVDVTLTPGGGTAYVAILRHGVFSARTAATYSAETVLAPLPGTITVTNGAFSTDTIRVTGLESGDIVRVYQANGTTLIGTATATASGANFEASLTNQTLTPTGGNVRVSIVRNTVESPKTTVSYNAEYVAPPAPVSITVTNNDSPADDTIAVTGLNAGDSIRVYRNGETTVTIAAVNGTASGTITLLSLGGSLNVSIVRNGVESTLTPVTYPAEIPNFVGAVSVINAEGNNDFFNLTGMVSGTTVEVFAERGGSTNPEWTGTVAANGTVSIPVTLTPAGGALSFRFTPPSGAVSTTIDVEYGAEPVTAPAAASIAVTNNSFDNDNVTVSDLQANDGLTIYRVESNGTLTQIGTGTAVGSAGNYAASVDVTLVPAGGTIAVRVTRSGLNSAATRVNYASEVVNAPDVADIQVANGSGTGTDSVTVGVLTNGDLITVTTYTSDDVQVDTDTATASGTTATANVDLSPLGGYATVTITRNTIVSAATRANYNAEPVAAPAPASIKVTNAPATSQDRVEVSDLIAGDYVTVVTYNASNNEVDRDTVAAQGTTATANVDLAPAGGFVAVSIIRYSNGGAGGVSSAATRVSYNAEIVPPPAVDDITVTNNGGADDTVVVRGLQPGDEIRVYNEDSVYLGPGTAVNGTATADVTLLPGGGTVWVMIFRNTLTSQGTQVLYASEVVAAPAVSDVTVANVTGASDAVTVAELQAGDIVTVTSADNGIQTWTGTVAVGATSVTIPVTLIPGGGIVQVTIERNTIVSPATGVPYAAEVVPAPSLSDISVSNVSNTGGLVDTVTITAITAGDIVRVYDSSYAEIGRSTSTGASATVTIPANLDTQGGSLFVTLERGGLMSDYVAVLYGAETIDPIDPALVSANNAVGNDDTLTVGGLNVGETLRVYRANGSILPIQISAGNPNVYETTFAAGGETLTLVRVRGGIESAGIAFTVGTELVPTVDEANIAVVNNTGNQDTVTVSVAAADYEAGDTYIVYDESMNSLGRSSVYADGAFTIPVTLLPTGGTVQVALERRTVVGPATSVLYTAEALAPNAGPSASDIIVTNGLDDNDPVVVDNVIAGDIVVVYDAEGAELGRATANADGSVTVRVNLADGSGGTVEVSIIRDGNESVRTPKTYDAYDSAQPPVPQEAQVTVVRSSDPNEEDIVTVTGLTQNDEVEFYDDENTQIGTATANASGVAVLRTLSLKSYASTLKLFVLRAGVFSGALAVSYPAKTATLTPPPAANIAVNNAAGIANDTVTVSGVAVGDRVRVYTSNGVTLLGEATATSSTVVVPVQLNAAAGSVRVSFVRGSAESAGTLKAYAAEPSTTPPPAAADITVVNAPGTANDTVTILGVASGDIVRVYSADGTVELGERASTGTSVVIYVALAAGGGTVGVSVERGGFQSTRTAVTYGAETAQKPNAPTTANITVLNNAGTVNDSVTVAGVQSGDLVRVYEANGSTPIGQATATGTSVTVPVALNAAGGSVTATIERGGTASDRSAAVTYTADPTPSAPSAPSAGNITVTNATGTTSDSVVVVDAVQSGDLVRVYAANGTTLLGQLLATGTSVTIPVELNPAGGSIRVTIERDSVESELSVPVPYTAEPGAPTAPDAPAATNITVDNQAGTTNDTVTVSNVQNGDLVRVYAANGTTLLGQHASTGTTAVVAVALGTAAGQIRVSIERGGAESELSVPVDYTAEPGAPAAPDAPAVNEVAVDNQAGATNDTVTVSNVQNGDLVRVYAANGATLLGQHTSTGTTAVVAVALGAAAGQVRVSIERGGVQSALSDPVDYAAEPAGPTQPTAPDAPAVGDITTNNSPGTANDTVTVSNVEDGDLVRVYANNQTTLLGQNTAIGATVTIPVELTTGAGDVYVSITRDGLESATTQAGYLAEMVPGLDAATYDTTVYPDGSGTIVVSGGGILAGDTVTVRDAGGTIGSAVAVSDGQITIDVPAGSLSQTGGTLEAVLERGGVAGNAPASFTYPAVPAGSPPPPSVTQITYDRDAGTVTVLGLEEGDEINVSVDGLPSQSSQPVANGETSATVGGFTFNPGGGTINVVLVRGGTSSAPSTRTYDAIAPSAANPDDITIANNEGAATDFVTVNNLTAGDRVIVYAGDGSTVLGQATATGSTLAVPVILDPAGGSVQVVIVRYGLQSPQTGKEYGTETSNVAAPLAGNITVTNNAGNNDTVTVTGTQIEAGDVITVYAADGVAILGKETATAAGTITLTVTLQPGTGSVQVSITRGTVESGKTPQSYTAEPGSVSAPDEDDITVVNNPGNSDSVTVTGVQVGDIVTVYANNGTTILGKEEVTTAGSITIDVALEPGTGSVQVSITRGTNESGQTTKSYDAETSAVTAPLADDITVVNNTGNADTVTVSGLQVGDIVTVYANDGIAVLGQATATANTLTLNVTLDAGTGNVLVAITRGNVQSDKTPKAYSAESNTVPAPALSDIQVVNNLGSQDTVTVTNVQVGDTITVYAANGTTVLARVTATTEGTLTIPLTLPEGSGSVNVTITRDNVESQPASPSYTAEPTTLDAPAESSITVNNLTGNSDNMTLTGLQAGDIITVYAANGTTILDRVTVGADPATWVVPITLNAAGGSVQVSITRGGIESGKTSVAYGAESAAVPAPAASSVTVNNNGATGSSVIVSDVQPGDIVTVYAANGTTVIGRAQVQPGETSITIPVSLNEAGGDLQVTITRGVTQSTPTVIAYAARVEEQPGTGGGGTGGGTAAPGDGAANPVTPATTPGGNNVTPETVGEGEELEADGTGRVVPLVTVGNRTFADIRGHWAQDSIERLASLGILNGKDADTFDANSDVTRAEFTKMVSSLLGIAATADPAFDDVDTDDWHAPHVQGAYEQGIVQGYGDGTFQPNDTITRQEMTQILMNSMQWLQSDVFGGDPDYDSASAYNDYASVGNWAQEPVARMLQEGLIIGKPGNRIDPSNNASRGEAATVILRLIDRMNNNFTIE